MFLSDQNIGRVSISRADVESMVRTPTIFHAPALKAEDIISCWRKRDYFKESYQWDDIRTIVADHKNKAEQLLLQDNELYRLRDFKYRINFEKCVTKKSGKYHFELALKSDFGEDSEKEIIQYALENLYQMGQGTEAIDADIKFEMNYDIKSKIWNIFVTCAELIEQKGRNLTETQEMCLLILLKQSTNNIRELFYNIIKKYIKYDVDTETAASIRQIVLNFNELMASGKHLPDDIINFCEKFNLPPEWFVQYALSNAVIEFYNETEEVSRYYLNYDFLNIYDATVQNYALTYYNSSIKSTTIQKLECEGYIRNMSISTIDKSKGGYVLTRKGLQYLKQFLLKNINEKDTFIIKILEDITPPESEYKTVIYTYEQKNANNMGGVNNTELITDPLYDGWFRRADNVRWEQSDKSMTDLFFDDKNQSKTSPAYLQKYSSTLYGETSAKHYYSLNNVPQPVMLYDAINVNIPEFAFNHRCAIWLYSPELQNVLGTNTTWFIIHDMKWNNNDGNDNADNNDDGEDNVNSEFCGVTLYFSSEDTKYKYEILMLSSSESAMGRDASSKLFFVPNPTYKISHTVSDINKYLRIDESEYIQTMEKTLGFKPEIIVTSLAHYINTSMCQNYAAFIVNGSRLKHIHSFYRLMSSHHNDIIAYTSNRDYAKNNLLNDRAMTLRAIKTQKTLIGDAQKYSEASSNKESGFEYLNRQTVNADDRVCLISYDDLISGLILAMGNKTDDDILGKKDDITSPEFIELCELVEKVRQSGYVNMLDTNGVLDTAFIMATSSEALEKLENMIKSKKYFDFLNTTFSNYLKSLKY